LGKTKKDADHEEADSKNVSWLSFDLWSTRSKIIGICLAVGLLSAILLPNLKTDELFVSTSSTGNIFHSLFGNSPPSNGGSSTSVVSYNGSNGNSRSITCMQSQQQPTFRRLLSSALSIVKGGTSEPEQDDSSLPSAAIQQNPVNSPSNDYVFSQNGSELSTPSNNTHTGDLGKGARIALVVPTFTAAAYNYNGFYDFYRSQANAPSNSNVTTGLNLLRVKVCEPLMTSTSNSAYEMLYFVNDLRWTNSQSKITVLADQDVDGGQIFGSSNTTNAYDIVILGHQEYVTQKEYDNLKQFVANGGIMIVLDGNVFYAEVTYDPAAGTIQLVKGHGWAFNGKSAWRSIGERWTNETREWVGSNYLCSRCTVSFANNPFGYLHHEEQYVTNPKDIILLNYNASITDFKRVPGRIVVATYELSYGKGQVIALGLYSDDIIANGRFDRYFDSLVEKYEFGHNTID